MFQVIKEDGQSYKKVKAVFLVEFFNPLDFTLILDSSVTDNPFS